VHSAITQRVSDDGIRDRRDIRLKGRGQNSDSSPSKYVIPKSCLERKRQFLPASPASAAEWLPGDSGASAKLTSQAVAPVPQLLIGLDLSVFSRTVILRLSRVVFWACSDQEFTPSKRPDIANEFLDGSRLRAVDHECVLSSDLKG
jgi:hypothetical protein